MELRQLRYLESIVAAGGFRRAARDLSVTQPTLTSQIEQLERDIGFPLLDRSTRPIRTTAAGVVVLSHARELLAVIERLNDEIGDMAQRQVGRLRLGANQWA